jgi:hypothetical protein
MMMKRALQTNDSYFVIEDYLSSKPVGAKNKTLIHSVGKNAMFMIIDSEILDSKSLLDEAIKEL